MKKILFISIGILLGIILSFQIEWLGFGEYSDCSRTKVEQPHYCAWRYGFAVKVFLTP